MAEGFSVKAVLSAVDRGFTSTMKSALSSVKSLASTVGSGMIMGAGMAAFNKLTGAASGLVKEVDASNAAWKTFSGNMGMLGKSSKEIESVKKELQSFAEQTVYSSSDMASTFAQLEAVGTKNTLSLVKGFGGLAAAAENPQQAMKTLSMQATQMAAKPKVAWEDFKLMLEQTPAGISAVAKEFGMSAADMVAAVQAGEIKTQDFFDAIAKVGTNDAFSKMATEAKTVGQAMDGLKETVGNKLTPAFDYLSKKGIKAVDKIAQSFSKINGEAIKTKLVSGVKAATPYWNTFKSAVSNVWKIISGVEKKMGPIFESAGKAIAKTVQKINRSIAKVDAKDIVAKIGGGIDKAVHIWEVAKGSFKGVGTALGEAFAAVKDSVLDMLGAFKGTGSMETFKGIMDEVAKAIKKVAGFIKENSDTIVKSVGTIISGFLAFKGLSKTWKGLALFIKFLPGLAKALPGVAKGLGLLGSKSALIVALGTAMKEYLTVENIAGFIEKAKPIWDSFVGVIAGVANGLMNLFKLILNNSDTVAKFVPYILGVVAAFKAFKIVNKIAPFLTKFGGMIKNIALKAMGAIPGLGSFNKKQDEVGRKSSSSTKKLLASAKAFMMVGAGTLLTAAGFALLAHSAIQLSNAGGLAIGVMAGLVVAVGALMIGSMAMLNVISASPTKIAKMSAALLALGASVLLISAGFALLSYSAIQVANSGGLAVGVLAGMMVGIAAIIAIIGTFGAGISAASAGLLAFGACVLMICAGLALAQGAFAALTPLVTAVGDAVPQVAATIADGVSQIVESVGSVLTSAFETAGNAISKVVESISEGIATVNDSIANVISAISEGLSGVLEGIASVISSVGQSARDAGEGFKAAAEGIKTVADLGLGDTIKAIGSVGAAMGEMAGHSKTLPAVAAGLTAIGTAITTIAAGADAFSAAITTLSNSTTKLADGMTKAKESLAGITMPSIDPSPVVSAFNAVSTAASKLVKDIADIGNKASTGFSSGMNSVCNTAKTAMKNLMNTFKNAGNQAKTSGKNMGTGFTRSLQSGLSRTSAVARQAVTSAVSQLRSGYSGAYSAGAYISQGFAAGMQSCLGAIQSAAAQMVAAADAAVRARARIHSPSKLFEKNGIFMGEGQEKGILSKVRDVWRAAEKLVQIPALEQNPLRIAYAGEMSADYDYYRNTTYTIVVPVDLDGKEIAKVTAPYTQEEIEKRQRREERKKGKI